MKQSLFLFRRNLRNVYKEASGCRSLDRQFLKRKTENTKYLIRRKHNIIYKKNKSLVSAISRQNSAIWHLWYSFA